MQMLVDLGTGVLQDELHVIRRVDERQVWQPSAGIELIKALDIVVTLFS